MKYAPRFYARAFLAALENAHTQKEREACIQQLCTALQSYGDMPHAKEVVDVVERMLVEKAGGRMAEIESARPLTSKAKKTVAKLFHLKDVVRERVNPGLIAGIRVTLDGEREFDGSLKRKLDRLFNKV